MLLEIVINIINFYQSCTMQQILNIHDSKNAFDKPLYTNKKNTLGSNLKIQQIDADSLNLMISCQYRDFKLYYHFRKWLKYLLLPDAVVLY